MKKLLKTASLTIALTAIGVGVRARVNKSEIKMYRFFAISQEKAYSDMIDYLNKNGLQYINHMITDDGIIFSYKGEASK